MPLGYDSSFWDNHMPSKSSLLPPQLATDLFDAGRGLGHHFRTRSSQRRHYR
jgi:hypothetical protein